MENKEYIQLPALSRDISEEELLCIWEFAKLPEEVQEQMISRVKEVLREETVQKKAAPDGAYAAMQDRINRYMDASRNDRSVSAGSIYISRMFCAGNPGRRTETGISRI